MGFFKNFILHARNAVVQLKARNCVYLFNKKNKDKKNEKHKAWQIDEKPENLSQVSLKVMYIIINITQRPFP